MAGILLAALGVAVLGIAIVALRHPGTTSTRAGVITQASPPSSPATNSSRPPTHPPSTPHTSTSSSAQPALVKLPLVVLNNTTIPKLADQARQRFEAGGWTVTSVGNLQNDIVSTCAYYDPSVAGAQAAAAALRAQFPTIKRVAPKFAELPAGPVVVVLTPDYSPG